MDLLKTVFEGISKLVVQYIAKSIIKKPASWLSLASNILEADFQMWGTVFQEIVIPTIQNKIIKTSVSLYITKGLLYFCDWRVFLKGFCFKYKWEKAGKGYLYSCDF